jgi:predicted Zn-dependent peptidase
MGGAISATSGQDFSLIEAGGLSEYVPDLIALIADVAMNPSLPEDELAALETRHLQALLQQQASPQFLSNRTFREALFRAHPYGRITAREADLKALDRQTVASFHATSYRPDRSTLIVVGDVRPEDVFEAAASAFGAWQRGDTRVLPLPPVQRLEGRRLVFVPRPGSVQSSISFGNPTVPRADPRWYALSVTNTLLGGSFNSRLTRKLREEKGYTYSPASQFVAFADAGLYRFAADVRNEVTGAAIRDMEAEMKRLQAEGAGAEELADIKQYARGLFSIRMAAPDLVADDLVTVYVFDLPKDYLQTYQTKITAVTPEEVKQAAGVLVTPDRSVLTIVGDWKAVKEQLTDYPDVSFVDSTGTTAEEPR